MTPRFRLTQPAIQDIEQIADYIARQSGLPQSEIFLSKLDAKFAKIAQFPGIGRQRDEILPGIRSLSIENYLILYMAIGQDVEIFPQDLRTLYEFLAFFSSLRDAKSERDASRWRKPLVEKASWRFDKSSFLAIFG